AEPAGKERGRVGFLDEDQLAREEVPKGQQLRVLGDDLVRPLLERQPDVDAEAVIRTRALLAGAHDAVAGAGDHHVAGIPDTLRKLEGGPARGRLPRGARRAEDADLPDVTVRREDLEGIAELAQRRVQDLDVADRRPVPQQLETGLDHLADELLVAREPPGRLGETREVLGDQVLSAARAGRSTMKRRRAHRATTDRPRFCL